jgi:DNA-binding NarL/FixJ family response regulator
MIKSSTIGKWKARVLFVNYRYAAFDHSSNPILELGNYQVVGIYRDIQNASHSLPKSKPEIMVLSIPDSIDAAFFERLKKIRITHPALKIIAITDCPEPELIFELLSVGISSILPADTKLDSITTCLDQIEQGLSYLSPKVTRVILDSFRLNLMPELSKRQVEILKLMFLGMTYSTIADKLSISKETTKTHMKNIYKKLNVNSKEEALSKAINDRIIFFNL